MKNIKLHIQASPAEKAQEAAREVTKRYKQYPKDKSNYLVVFGGDGETLHATKDGIKYKKPVMSFNLGHLGFLGNPYKKGEDIESRIRDAEVIKLSPLRVEATFLNGDVRTAFAVNEVHICNHNRTEGIYLKVSIDGKERMPCLGADGLIVSTTAGSTAYSKSAGGPILPLGDDMIALTPNNAFKPDRVRAAVIRPRPIDVEVLSPDFRQADVYVDNESVGEGCVKVKITLDKRHPYRLLFDKGYGLHEKIMRTQFSDQQLG